MEQIDQRKLWRKQFCLCSGGDLKFVLPLGVLKVSIQHFVAFGSSPPVKNVWDMDRSMMDISIGARTVREFVDCTNKSSRKTDTIVFLHRCFPQYTCYKRYLFVRVLFTWRGNHNVTAKGHFKPAYSDKETSSQANPQKVITTSDQQRQTPNMEYSKTTKRRPARSETTHPSPVHQSHKNGSHR